MNNNKNKATVKKYKFNIVDTAVIVIICTSVLFLALVLDPFGWVDELINKKEIEVACVIEFKAIENSTAKNIRENDIVLSSNEQEQIVSITKVEKYMAYEWVPDLESGTMQKQELKNKINVFVTLAVKCTYKEGEGYYLNGDRFAVGSEISIKFPSLEYKLSGSCVSIVEID